MTNKVDACPNSPRCNGRLRIVSLDRQERIRRRLGRAWLGRCVKCGAECQVNSQAWRMFAKELREVKRESARAVRDRQQPSLF